MKRGRRDRVIQPVKNTEVLPEQHRYRVSGTEHRDFDHRNHEAIQGALKAEAGKLHDQRVVTDTTHTQSRRSSCPERAFSAVGRYTASVDTSS